MGILYVVATPIGNLEDITLRALRVLKEVDLILCEDTRHAKRLLDHYEITTKTMSYHQHSGVGKVNLILQKLREGQHLALISDAGTPGINDPGVALVHELALMLDDEVAIVPVPGSSAVVAALSVSGLPSHDFRFIGFLPHKKGRETIFSSINEAECTTVFYESTHRIKKTLERLEEILESARWMVVGREITKKFEAFYRGSPEDVLKALKQDSWKGEFVVMIGPRTADWSPITKEDND